jgi:1,4-dihydroxy-2-naphthoate octaprenyltransferase
MDKAAGLNNTAIVLGENNARRAMYVTVALAAVCLLAAIILGVFPLWLGLVLAGSVLVSMMFRPQTDMRGGEAVEISGGLQIQGLLIANLTIAVWLVANLASQINLF